jgi:hypothetical protein
VYPMGDVAKEGMERKIFYRTSTDPW